MATQADPSIGSRITTVAEPRRATTRISIEGPWDITVRLCAGPTLLGVDSATYLRLPGWVRAIP